MCWDPPSLLSAIFVHERDAADFAGFLVRDLNRPEAVRLWHGGLDGGQIACLQSALAFSSERYGEEVA